MNFGTDACDCRDQKEEIKKLVLLFGELRTSRVRSHFKTTQSENAVDKKEPKLVSPPPPEKFRRKSFPSWRFKQVFVPGDEKFVASKTSLENDFDSAFLKLVEAAPLGLNLATDLNEDA